jgi:hypothetical protein
MNTNWIQIFIKLIPIFMELFGNKAKGKEVTSAQNAIDCWQNPKSRAEFVGQVLDEGLNQKVITFSEAAELVVAIIEHGDNPMVVALVQLAYKEVAQEISTPYGMAQP